MTHLQPDLCEKRKQLANTAFTVIGSTQKFTYDPQLEVPYSYNLCPKCLDAMYGKIPHRPDCKGKSTPYIKVIGSQANQASVSQNTIIFNRVMEVIKKRNIY